MKEPAITVNAVALTEGQAMSVRVAVTCLHFEMCLQCDDDDAGRAMTEGYKARLGEVLELMRT